MQLDIKEYYPSITEEMLDKFISLASNLTTASLKDMHIIKHSRRLWLFHLEQAWKKKESSSCFDVTVGSNDGAELQKLIGIFTESVLQWVMGLYRDDVLIVLNKVTRQKTENDSNF